MIAIAPRRSRFDRRRRRVGGQPEGAGRALRCRHHLPAVAGGQRSGARRTRRHSRRSCQGRRLDRDEHARAATRSSASRRSPRRKASRMLECPVTGGVHQAADGEITVLAGGDTDAVRAPPAGAAGHGRRDLPHGPAGLGRGHQGHHQHAGLHPSGGGRRGADAGQAGRPRSRPGVPCDPRQLRQQLRARDRKPADPQRQLRHRLHHGPRAARTSASPWA